MKFLLAVLALVTIFNYASAQNACGICELIVPYVEYGVKVEGWNATQIEQQLESYCASFPVIATYCDAVVELYLDKIIQEVVDGESADQVCTDVGLCTSKVIKGKQYIY